MTLIWDEDDVVVLNIKWLADWPHWIYSVYYLYVGIKSNIDPLECLNWCGLPGLKAIALWLISDIFESIMTKYSSIIYYIYMIEEYCEVIDVSDEDITAVMFECLDSEWEILREKFAAHLSNQEQAPQ